MPQCRLPPPDRRKRGRNHRWLDNPRLIRRVATDAPTAALLRRGAELLLRPPRAEDFPAWAAKVENAIIVMESRANTVFFMAISFP